MNTMHVRILTDNTNGELEKYAEAYYGKVHDPYNAFDSVAIYLYDIPIDELAFIELKFGDKIEIDTLGAFK
jgi:hypothetical protein